MKRDYKKIAGACRAAVWHLLMSHKNTNEFASLVGSDSEFDFIEQVATGLEGPEQVFSALTDEKVKQMILDSDPYGPLQGEDEPEDTFRDDVEADADVLRSAGMGTDEDYGYFGEEE